MKYNIFYKNPNRHFLDLELIIENIEQEYIFLQLPAWRPGRYELQNFAKNIQKFEVYSPDNQLLRHEKVKKDLWKVHTKDLSQIRVKYNYYAQQFDAGGSIVEEDMLYINFINCMLYVVGRIEESYEVQLHIPKNFKIACGLPKHGHTLYAKNFYELVDAPLLASSQLQMLDYGIDSTEFYLWFYGNVSLDRAKIIQDFSKFSREQVNIFGEFPEKEYHFLFIITPQNFYHGVEHFNSTVIVLGSDSNFHKFYPTDLLGIASHELFHAWNAIRIRPVELMPYDFTQENYFRTGYVVEGITTYYGDYLLARSGVWSLEWYLIELNNLLKRYFDNFGHLNMSLADSSFDLWLDGYAIGIPNRKVSIYHKGAVIALILDLEIRRLTQNRSSLDTLMLALWQDFGLPKKGYSEKDYQESVEKIVGVSMNDYFRKFVYGIEPVEFTLKKALSYVGLELQTHTSERISESAFGFQTGVFENRVLVTKIYPNSPADFALSLKDEIFSVNGKIINEKVEYRVDKLLHFGESEIVISRNGTIRKYSLMPNGQTFFNRYEVKLRKDMSANEKANLQAWLNISF